MIQNFIPEKYLPIYLLAFTLIGIITLSLIPATGIQSEGILGFTHLDKIGHFLAYTIFSFFAGLVFVVRRKYITALLFGFVLGIVLEKMQSFIPGRNMSVLDVYANTSGLVVGFIIIYFLQKK